MKKLFSKEIIFISPLIMILSFFLFTSNVSATEYTGTLDDSYFAFDTNNEFTILKNYVVNYMQENNLPYYIILWKSGRTPTTLLAYVFSSIPSFTFSPYSYNLAWSSSDTSSQGFNIGLNSSTVSSLGTPSIDYHRVYVNDPNYGNRYDLIDANFPIIASYTGGDTYTLNTSYGNIVISNNSTFPLLYSLSHPIPSDPIPLATTYYSLIIEKLGIATDYFKDNPYLYIIPLIPIFYLCIYLIKRSLIK